MAIPEILDLIAGGGEDWPIPFANARRTASANVNHPHFLLHTCGVACWIGEFAGLVLISTADVGKGVSVRRENQIGQLLAVVAVVAR
jgi:hypothetical protein